MTYWRAWTWLVLVVITAAVAGFTCRDGLPVETDVLALLPSRDRDPLLTAARRHHKREISRKLMILVAHAERRTAQRAVQRLVVALRRSPAFVTVRAKFGLPTPRTLQDLYFPYRAQLLSAADRRTLRRQDGAERFLADTRRLLHSPTLGTFGSLLARDPLLLFFRFVAQLPGPPGRLTFDGQFLRVSAKGSVVYLVEATLADSVYSLTLQRQATGALKDAAQALQQEWRGISVTHTGLLRFVVAAGQASNRDLRRIGLLAVVGIVALFLLTFWSLRQLALALLPILVGSLCAVTAVTLIFGKVHLITLIFGTSLIGVCIDYAFHYSADRLLGGESWTSTQGLARIFPGIALGALTSVIGYLSFFTAPFPLLQQMATFSAIGLVAAFVTVVSWSPPLIGGATTTRKRLLLLPIARGLAQLPDRLRRSPRARNTAAFLALILCVAGWYRLSADDDVAQLHRYPDTLLAEDDQIRSSVGGFATSRFLFVEGSSEQQLLARLEQLGRRLRAEKQSAALRGFLDLSRLVPSPKRQRDDHRLLRSRLVDSGKLQRWMTSIGFAQPIVAAQIARLKRPIRPLHLSRWISSELAQPFRSLFVHAGTRLGAIVLVDYRVRSAAMQQLANTMAGVHFADEGAEISQLFGRYRRHFSLVLLLAYGAIFLLLLVRYGVQRSVRILFPPLAAAGITLALFGLLNYPITLFTILALILVCGIGIDYTIFFAEAGRDHRATSLAILLSALTTILSFGLLALSHTPLLRTFGLTLLIGIALALLLAPLAVARDGESNRSPR